MRKSYFALAFVFFSIVPSLCHAEANGENGAVLLVFSATWCGPCQRMKPTIEGLISQGMPIQKIDLDRNRAMASRYRVTAVPTYVVVDSRGRELGRTSGPQPANALIRFYQSGASKIRQNQETQNEPPSGNTAQNRSTPPSNPQVAPPARPNPVIGNRPNTPSVHQDSWANIPPPSRSRSTQGSSNNGGSPSAPPSSTFPPAPTELPTHFVGLPAPSISAQGTEITSTPANRAGGRLLPPPPRDPASVVTQERTLPPPGLPNGFVSPIPGEPSTQTPQDGATNTSPFARGRSFQRCPKCGKVAHFQADQRTGRSVPYPTAPQLDNRRGTPPPATPGVPVQPSVNPDIFANISGLPSH